MFTTITCYDRDPPWLTKRVDVFLNKKMRSVKISCKKTQFMWEVGSFIKLET